MVHFASHLSQRSIFIAKHGILRRGTLVGAIVTALFIVAGGIDHIGDAEDTHAVALGAMCFLEWTIGAGWLIGATMWSSREQAARRARDRRL